MQRQCSALCFEPRSASYVRDVDGERVITGYTESKLMVAIDLARMVERLGREIGHHRQERFELWLDGQPVTRFGATEQVQLRADVQRLEGLVNAGGYRFMLNRYHLDCSGSP
jgi:hypothetical protein